MSISTESNESSSDEAPIDDYPHIADFDDFGIDPPFSKDEAIHDKEKARILIPKAIAPNEPGGYRIYLSIIHVRERDRIYAPYEYNTEFKYEDSENTMGKLPITIIEEMVNEWDRYEIINRDRIVG